MLRVQQGNPLDLHRFKEPSLRKELEYLPFFFFFSFVILLLGQAIQLRQSWNVSHWLKPPHYIAGTHKRKKPEQTQFTEAAQGTYKCGNREGK